jgi:hypothetical protein
MVPVSISISRWRTSKRPTVPTASSSASSKARCSAFFVASSTIKIRSLVLAADMTCLPLPLPSDAPSMIPGRSSSWISAPPYSKTPGMAVRVVKAYDATSERVFVTLDRNVDFPTDGKPTKAILASPLLLTSKPAPPPPPEPGPGSRSCARRRASFLRRVRSGRFRMPTQTYPFKRPK